MHTFPGTFQLSLGTQNRSKFKSKFLDVTDGYTILCRHPISHDILMSILLHSDRRVELSMYHSIVAQHQATWSYVVYTSSPSGLQLKLKAIAIISYFFSSLARVSVSAMALPSWVI